MFEDFFESSKKEFIKSPIATICAIINLLIVISNILLAVNNSQKIEAQFYSKASENTEIYFSIANLCSLISYFFAMIFIAFFVIRLISNKNFLAAFFASLIITSLVNFSTIVMVMTIPPLSIHKIIFNSVHDLVFYASVTSIVLFFGQSIFESLVVDAVTFNNNKLDDDLVRLILFKIMIAIFILCIWGKGVFIGQIKLTQSFLPEIVHYKK